MFICFEDVTTISVGTIKMLKRFCEVKCWFESLTQCGGWRQSSVIIDIEFCWNTTQFLISKIIVCLMAGFLKAAGSKLFSTSDVGA